MGGSRCARGQRPSHKRGTRIRRAIGFSPSRQRRPRRQGKAAGTQANRWEREGQPQTYTISCARVRQPDRHGLFNCVPGVDALGAGGISRSAVGLARSGRRIALRPLLHSGNVHGHGGRRGPEDDHYAPQTGRCLARGPGRFGRGVGFGVAVKEVPDGTPSRAIAESEPSRDAAI